MEVEYDKEIDALLRTSAVARAGPRDIVSGHLSADEIAAFAENALPQQGRVVFIRHFGSCERCRTILATVIALNSETHSAAERPPTTTAPAAAELPWYGGFFQFPQLAYVMGGLVLIFATFIAFSVVQNRSTDSSPQISQADLQEDAIGGPSAAADEPAEIYSNANANTSIASNTASTVTTVSTQNVSGAAANSAVAKSGNSASVRSESAAQTAPEKATDKNNFVLDGVQQKSTVTDSAVAGSPAPPPAAKSINDSERQDARALSSRLEGLPSAKEKKETQSLLRVSPGTTQQSPSTKAKRRSGPINNQAQVQNNAGSAYDFTGRRSVAGRNFELKQGVWYDAAYRGQGTTNIRRGAEAYKKLDAGLRSITETLGGTVVVVWRGTAYRIR